MTAREHANQVLRHHRTRLQAEWIDRPQLDIDQRIKLRHAMVRCFTLEAALNSHRGVDDHTIEARVARLEDGVRAFDASLEVSNDRTDA